MKKVLCLYRVSTLGQADPKDDIPMQRRECEAFIEQQEDWVFYGERLEKGVSGYKVSANKRDVMLYDMYGILLKAYRPENIAFLGGSSGAFMALCLVSYINRDKEKLPIPGKLCLCSPGSALEAEERKAAERLNRTDLIMSMAALDNIFAGMAGGKALPEYLRYMQRGIYTGVRDVYLTYGGDEVFSAAAESMAARLRSYGAAVELEIGRGLYHAYAALPLVPEAKPAYQRVIQYLKV